MKNKLKKIRESLDIPMGIISGYYMEIYSGKEIVLNGEAEVLELEDTVLKLKCGEHRIYFNGKNIRISCYTNETIKINGNITGIEFY